MSSNFPVFSDSHLKPFHKVVRGAELVRELQSK